MNRITLTAIALLSALAAPVAVHATGRAAVTAGAAPLAASQAEEPPCARPIRIVYAGYGEAGAFACVVANAKPQT